MNLVEWRLSGRQRNRYLSATGLNGKPLGIAGLVRVEDSEVMEDPPANPYVAGQKTTGREV